MSSFAQMSDPRPLPVLEQAVADRRQAADDLAHAVRVEHEAVWQAIDAGASWRDLAWLVDEPLTTFYHRHRDRENPRIGRVTCGL